MSKTPIISFSLFITLILVTGAPLSRAASPTLTISTFEEETAVVRASVLLKRAYKKLGVDMKLIRFPASRALVEANAGRSVDGELIRIAGLTQQYPNLIQIPVRIANFRISVFSKTVDFPVNGWPSLKPYEITFKRGFKGMEKHADGLNVTRVRSSEKAMEMLNMDRTDIIVTPYLDGLVIRKKLNLPRIRILPPPLEEVQLYHYLNRKHADLSKGITEELRSMERKGEIARFWNDVEKEFSILPIEHAPLHRFFPPAGQRSPSGPLSKAAPESQPVFMS